MSLLYSAACVGSLLSVALLAAFLIWSEFWRLLRLHGLIFRTRLRFVLQPGFPMLFRVFLSFAHQTAQSGSALVAVCDNLLEYYKYIVIHLSP